MIFKKQVCPVCNGAGEVTDKNTSALRPCAFCKSIGHIKVEVVKKKKRLPRKAPKKYIGWVKICAAITEYQKEYLETRDIMKLRPMKMSDIAKIVGAHVTNICKSVKGKSINGIAARELFSEEVSGISNKTAMHVVKLLAIEHPSLNDGQLLDKLSERGISLSRRTVAKYRQMLGIEKRGFFNVKK